MTTLAPPRSEPDARGGDPLLAVGCPACHAALAAPRTMAGAAGRCPVCQEAFLVPRPPRRVKASGDQMADDAAKANDTLLILSERERKALRRTRRNLLMLFSGVLILLALVLLFGTRRPKKRR